MFPSIHLSDPLLKALAHLCRAREYAGDAGVDPWQFAVEWRVLKSAGVEPTDARWLIARHLVEFRREITVPLAMRRTFVECDVPRLTPDSAFILTDTGAAYCRGLSQEAAIPENIFREIGPHSLTDPHLYPIVHRTLYPITAQPTSNPPPETARRPAPIGTPTAANSPSTAVSSSASASPPPTKN